jgi:membrane protease YdiL (CAAX protease family)
MHALAITEICVVIFSWAAIRLLVGKDWKRKLALRRPGLAHSIMAVLGLPALWILGVGLYVMAKHVFHIPGLEDLLKIVPGMGDANIPLMEELMNSIRQWPLPVAVLVIGLGPGIGEELWCRGFLARGLVGRYGVVIGIAVTSFFFGLIHVDPAQGIMAMLMGVCLHFVYQTTRSLWLSILLHFLNNSLSVVVLRFPELDAIEQQPSSFLPLFVGAIILAAVLAYTFYQSRARLVPEVAGARYHWQPDFPGVEYPPAGCGTVVAHPLPSKFALSAVASAYVLFVLSCCML